MEPKQLEDLTELIFEHFSTHKESSWMMGGMIGKDRKLVYKYSADFEYDKDYVDVEVELSENIIHKLKVPIGRKCTVKPQQ